MRDEAANKIFKIDAATLAMCACTKNPNRRRDASEGNKNVYGAWHVYMCIYIHIYVYKRAATKEAETTQRTNWREFRAFGNRKSFRFCCKF